MVELLAVDLPGRRIIFDHLFLRSPIVSRENWKFFGVKEVPDSFFFFLNLIKSFFDELSGKGIRGYLSSISRVFYPRLTRLVDAQVNLDYWKEFGFFSNLIKN